VSQPRWSREEIHGSFTLAFSRSTPKSSKMPRSWLATRSVLRWLNTESNSSAM
jgi:hypothetical protein